MIVEIAFARDGFLPMKTNQTAHQKNFKSILESMFYFTTNDILEFDGNTCQIKNKENPTNSIFFFDHIDETLLYTITNATPRVHKGNLIWDCQCYAMESVDKISNMTAVGKSVQALMYKNIKSKEIQGGYDLRDIYLPTVKENFKTAEVIKEDINTVNDVGMLKIKCLVNPTTENLTSFAPDGSYCFYFPIGFETTPGDPGYNIAKPTNTITDGTNTLSIQEVISKYSENIKSIEFIPFCPRTNNEMDGFFSNLLASAGEVSFVLGGSAIWTDCGVFINNDHYNKFAGFYNFRFSACELPEQLLLGGGARGFLRTPLGNIELDFNSKGVLNIATDIIQYGRVVALFACMKEEGWKIDGQARCDVPPMYVNFYTDNAGQLFIQNLTTNAQELRQMEREKVLKETKIASDYAYSQLEAGTSGIGALLSGNLLSGIFGTAGNVAKNQVQYEKNLSEYRAEYNVSKAQYDDKIKTQSLLASLTGKQLSGNVSLFDFAPTLNSFSFQIVIEVNFTLQRINLGGGAYEYSFQVQKDYDYSVNSEPRLLGLTGLTEKKVLLVNTDETTPGTEYNKDLETFMQEIFGFGSSQHFQDKIGCNYQISFMLQNSYIIGDEDASTFDFTKTLSFNVRRETQKLTY